MFQAVSHYTPHLAPGETKIEAIIGVEVEGEATFSPISVERVVGFIADKSGSMEGGRISAVNSAISTAIDKLDGSTIFFVVAFDSDGKVVFAPAPATEENKVRAKTRVMSIEARGGTAMSTGLREAHTIFARYPDAIRRVLFLTDGDNEGESSATVERMLQRCEGVFEADCWGLGTNWKVGEVQLIAKALNGKASLLPGPKDVDAAFAGFVDVAQSKGIRDVRLRLWVPQGARLVQVRQMNPTIEDLLAKSRNVSPLVRDYPTGAWGPGEQRDYHVTIEVQPGQVGNEVLACRPGVVYKDGSGQDVEVKTPEARIIGIWSSDDRLTSRINATVANYTGQGEMAAAIQDGLAAQEKGDMARATELLGRAVKLAHDTGNDAMTSRLRRVVDIDDAASGTVRVKRGVKAADSMDLQLESTTTKRARRNAPGSV